MLRLRNVVIVKTPRLSVNNPAVMPRVPRPHAIPSEARNLKPAVRGIARAENNHVRKATAGPMVLHGVAMETAGR